MPSQPTHPPESRPFFLFGIDTTGCPRPYANTLGDRGIRSHINGHAHCQRDFPAPQPLGM